MAAGCRLNGIRESKTEILFYPLPAAFWVSFAAPPQGTPDYELRTLRFAVHLWLCRPVLPVLDIEAYAILCLRCSVLAFGGNVSPAARSLRLRAPFTAMALGGPSFGECKYDHGIMTMIRSPE